MNLDKFIALLILFLLSATTATADIYDDCEAAINRGDLREIKALSSTMQRYPNSTLANLGQAALCVSTAEDQPMTFIVETKTWVFTAGLEDTDMAVVETLKAIADLQYRQAQELENSAALAAQELEDSAALAAQELNKIEAVRLRICELREVLAETSLTLQEAEVAQQDRRIETLAATVQECSTWFDSDPRSALTNDICNSIFVSGGLPNSEVSGPSTSEILLAELINENASTELEILIEFGMLLESFQQMANDMGISEDGDPYDCDA